MPSYRRSRFYRDPPGGPVEKHKDSVSKVRYAGHAPGELPELAGRHAGRHGARITGVKAAMSLRAKVVLFVLGVSAAFAGSTYVVQSSIVLPGFAEVEHTEAVDDLARCRSAIFHDAEFLSNSANDYASWDDTYLFIEDGNETYQTANLIPETFENIKLNLFAFIHKSGTLVWGEVRRNKGQEVMEAGALLANLARADHRLVAFTEPDAKMFGVYMTSLGPMLVGSAPVSTSDRSAPVRGAVIMGRFITDELIEEVAQRTRVPLTLRPIDATPEAERAALTHLNDGADTWVNASSADTLAGYALMDDIFEQPALLLSAHMPRTISQRGRTAAALAATTSIGAGLAMVVLMWFVLSRMIVDPLTRVTRHAVRVGSEDDLRARLNMTSEDEIGVMAREFDRMVDRLAESRTQLLEVAHHAGMARVAGDVLHNVGNVLNSVNVSADVIREQLHHSEAGTLKLAAQLLAEHEGDLADFLTGNERGRQLPAFLTGLAEQLGSEQERMLEEVQSLSQAVEHIRQVVDLQQKHAGHQALVEAVDPTTVVEQAVTLCGESVARHGVELIRAFDKVGEVPLDKHRVLQVLVNLLTNAIQAVKAKNEPVRRITLALRHESGASGSRLHFRVEDNGVGIPAENLDRIFAFGFTTRPEGQGIGLHSAANLAREMGGTLSAASDGPGRGAVFVLEVPAAVAETVS